MTRPYLLCLLTALTAGNVAPIRCLAADTGETAEESDAEVTQTGNDRLDAKGVGISGGILVGAEAVIAAQAAFKVNKPWMYAVFPTLGAASGGVGGYFLEKASAPGAVALLVSGIAFIIPTAILTASAFSYNPEKESALKADAENDKPFSFELPPDVHASDRIAETVTEVSREPEVGPPADAVPPKEASPARDAAPSESEEETPPSDAAPDPKDIDSPPLSSARSRSRTRHASNAAQPGSLLCVGETGVSVSVPLVDVRPIDAGFETSRRDGATLRNRRLQFHIPLLRVDLP